MRQIHIVLSQRLAANGMLATAMQYIDGVHSCGCNGTQCTHADNASLMCGPIRERSVRSCCLHDRRLYLTSIVACAVINCPLNVILKTTQLTWCMALHALAVEMHHMSGCKRQTYACYC